MLLDAFKHPGNPSFPSKRHFVTMISEFLELIALENLESINSAFMMWTLALL
jgi:hypothetical protein